MLSWYPYRLPIHGILALDDCKEENINISFLRSWTRPTVTPINVSFWKTKLANHYDERFAKWLIQGFSEGFRIGYPRQGTGPLKSAGRNMLSAKSHKELVSSYLKAELQEGQVACCGPVSMTKLLNIYVSPFGVIPKKGRPN